MRFYQQQHAFYCGVDLHAKTMHVCMVDAAGEIQFHRNTSHLTPPRIRTSPEQVI